MIAVLCHFQIKSVKEILKGKFFHSGTFPRNICEFLRRELLIFFICSCFIIHSPPREPRRGLNENPVSTTVLVHLSQFYFFCVPHSCNFLLLRWSLLYGFCTVLDILFVKCICDNFHWRFLWFYVCVFRQDVDAAIWGGMGEEFARWQPSGKNTALRITQEGRRQMPGLWPVKSR